MQFLIQHLPAFSLIIILGIKLSVKLKLNHKLAGLF
jgi:hypothetical protein